MLSQLPLTFARVSNFLGAEKDDEPVKGGVDKPGQGCLECHGRDDQFPQSTLPFPWVAITPTPSPTPLATPTPSTTRSEGTSYLEPAQPANISTTPNEQVFAPPVSGTAGEIMVTYRDPDQPDHSSLYVGEQRRDGSVAYYRTGTDDNHHVLLWIATDVTKLTFFKGFDTSGAPDAGAGESIVSEVAHVSGTERVPNIPSSGPAIVAADSAYNLNGGTIAVETRETSIGDALRIDRADLQTLALSDRSIVAQIPQQMPLGRHVLSLDSRHAAEQAVPFDEVSLYADPVPPVENVGDRANPTIHVEGLPVGDQAVIDFEVGGSAALEGGGNTITVPVQDGVAKCSIVGVRPGHAIVRYHLRVTLSR